MVIYEDDGGKLSYQTFDGDVLLITMTTLRERTRGLSFTSTQDIPGAASDRALVKLALLRQLAQHDPNVPGRFPTPLHLARATELDGWPLRHPAVGHQDLDQAPDTVAKWFALGREDDAHLAERVSQHLVELHTAGLLSTLTPEPRLSFTGGDAVLRLARAESAEAT